MGRSTGRTGRTRRRVMAVATAAAVLGALCISRPADAAGLSLPVQMGQRFLGSPSPQKALPLPLAAKIGPIRSLAVAGVEGTTFSPIKDPVLGITIFSSSEVKTIILDTINGLEDNTTLAFKINSLEHTDTAEFAIGGNCVGADGSTTPICVAQITFTPTTVGTKMDPVNAHVSITQGMPEVENALHSALANQGVKGTLINIIYPIIRGYIQDTLTAGIESALLAPVAILVGTGVAGPFTDPAVFVRRQYADFAAGTPSSATVASWVQGFEDGKSPIAFLDQLRKGDAWHGRVGPVTRLYSAYFLRRPDTGGLTYWTNRSRNGTRLYAISSTFAASSEFQRRYGALTNRQFVELVYHNVLGRNPDPSGLAYWTRQMDNGKTRGRLMVGFSESSEYIRKQGPNVAVIDIWFGMLHRMPTDAELTGYAKRISDGTPATTIETEVLASTEYRAVVLG